MVAPARETKLPHRRRRSTSTCHPTTDGVSKGNHNWKMSIKGRTNNDIQSTYHASHYQCFHDRINDITQQLSIGDARERRQRQRPRTEQPRRWAHPFIRIKQFTSIIFFAVMICLTARLDAFNSPAIYFYSHRRGTLESTHHHVNLYSAPAKNSDSYDFDAIEEEFIRDQSLQPHNKSIRSKTKKVQKMKRKGTLPTEPTAPDKTSNRKKRRRSSSSKAAGGTAPVEMPIWLAQYEHEDFSNSYYLAEELQSTSPDAQRITSVDAFDFDNSYEDEDNEQIPLSEMQRLQLALNGIFYQPTTTNYATTSGSLPDAIPYFTPSEIHEVMDAIRVASHGNSNLMTGCAEFLYLMLTLEEEGILTSDFLDEHDDGWENHEPVRRRPAHEPHSIMTRDILVAAAFHYCDCVRARKAGVYDYAREAMEASLDMRIWKELEEKKQLWLPPAATEDSEDGDDDALRYYDGGQELAKNAGDGNKENTAPDVEDNESMVLQKRVTRRGTPPLIEHYGEESVKIASDAARLKRAEIMATTVNSNNNGNNRKISRFRGNNAKKNQHSSGDSEILRSFLVSLSEDWRALVIRSAACLYRLKGISSDGRSENGSMVLSTSTINTARDAFNIYAPLAQRLGMQRLKGELENTAFRILYPRQFSVASSLYIRDIDEVKSIVRVLSSRIEQLLRSDPAFFDQIMDVTVTSRVKEPYSLWRKMLRYRKEAADAKNKAAEKNMDDDADDRRSRNVPSTLSLKWVPDSIAFRVVLSAQRLSPLEDDESLRTREKMLCYYAMQIISDIWPASARNEAKDYIKNPKPNGYQSLHYTANLMISGEEWPFEVQIRSEEMHRIAEFGVAAHWDYKLKPLSSGNTPMLALPSEIKPVEAAEVGITEVSSKVSQKGRVASYIDALTTSRETIVQNNLFVFLSSTESALDGRIVSTDPSASYIADVLEKYGATDDRRILDDISDGTLKIYQNGIISSLNERLSNGDVLTLPSIIIDKLTVE